MIMDWIAGLDGWIWRDHGDGVSYSQIWVKDPPKIGGIKNAGERI